MATWTVELGAGRIVYFQSLGGVWSWTGDVGPVDSALVAGGGTANIGRIEYRRVSGIFRLQLRARPSDFFGDAGPDLTPAWESAAAAIILEEVGRGRVLVRGPNHPSTADKDTSEPYLWEPDDAAILAWFNALGAGVVRVTLTDGSGVPDVVGNFSASPEGRTAIDLSWDAPASVGASDITGYRIEVSTDGSAWSELVASQTARTYRHSGLSPGTTRHYRVRAINSVGNGDWTTAQATTASLSGPSAPPDFTVAADGRTAFDLSWGVPTDNGGAAITGYRIEVSVDGGTNWSQLVASQTGRTSRHSGFPDITGATTRHYRVRGINSVGGGTWATAQATIPALARASVVRNLSSAADGRNAVDLSWDAPAEDGGTPVTGYRIETSLDGTNWSLLSLLVATSFRHTGIAAATTLQYRVGALNRVGLGPWALTQATTDPLERPGPVRDFTALAEGRTVIALSWEAPEEDGGTPVTGYRIEVSEDGLAWSELVASLSGRTYRHVDLEPDTTRHYRVRATNSVGPGDWVTAQATTVPRPPPSSRVVEGRLRTVQESDKDLANVIEAAGPGDGLNRFHLIVRDQASINRYGERWAQLDFADATTMAELRSKALEVLERRKDPQTQFQLVARPSAEEPEFGVGDRIVAVDTLSGEVIEDRIYELSWRQISGGRSEVTIFLSAPPADLIDEILEGEEEEVDNLSIPLSAPTGFRVVPIVQGVRVHLNPYGGGRAAGSEIHLSTEGPDFVADVTTLARRGQQTSFDLTGLTGGVRYFVRARSYDQAGEFSEFTETRSAVAGLLSAELTPESFPSEFRPIRRYTVLPTLPLRDPLGGYVIIPGDKAVLVNSASDQYGREFTALDTDGDGVADAWVNAVSPALASGIWPSGPTISLRINREDFDVTANGRGYLHGFDANGQAVDEDGYVIANGMRAPVLRKVGSNLATFYTHAAGANVRGVLLLDLAGANFVIPGFGNTRVAFARKVGTQWQYSTGSDWRPLTTTASHLIIGTLTMAAGGAIAQGSVWTFGVGTDQLGGFAQLDMITAAEVVSYLAAGAINTRELAVGSVRGDVIHANTITTRELSLGSYDNLILNPGFESGNIPAGGEGGEGNPAYYHPGSGGRWQTDISQARSGTGGRCARFDVLSQTGTARLAFNGRQPQDVNGSRDPARILNHIACSEDDQFSFAIYAKHVLPSGARPAVSMRIDFYGPSGAQLTGASRSVTTTTTWQPFVLDGTAPAGAVSVAFSVDVARGGAGTAQIFFDDAYARQKLLGSLIVDGTIVAENLRLGVTGSHHALVANAGGVFETTSTAYVGSTVARITIEPGGSEYVRVRYYVDLTLRATTDVSQRMSRHQSVKFTIGLGDSPWLPTDSDLNRAVQEREILFEAPTAGSSSASTTEVDYPSSGPPAGFARVSGITGTAYRTTVTERIQGAWEGVLPAGTHELKMFIRRDRKTSTNGTVVASIGRRVFNAILFRRMIGHTLTATDRTVSDIPGGGGGGNGGTPVDPPASGYGSRVTSREISGITDPVGVAQASSSTLLVASRANGGTIHFRDYNGNQKRVSEELPRNFSLLGGILYGSISSSFYLWALDQSNDGVYVYSVTTSRLTSGSSQPFTATTRGFDAGPSGAESGIDLAGTAAGSLLWLLDFNDDRLYAFNRGVNPRATINVSQSEDTPSYVDSPRGVTYDTTRNLFFIVGNGRVTAMNRSGQEQTSYRFNLASVNSNPRGAQIIRTGGLVLLFVPDLTDNRVYCYDISAP